ncbi:hypothetical protein HanXRQr2_Chr06g0257191 [Helianthus annuus]|uniref:Uncharacterized protein n=1 Tax=Helianthus annuus TaxID=4232 RepID=A0A9K3ISY7_HELAN|nr:hypothetical protein HanXRQr2_Chr06g0257191 [Helianthus annuus]
MKWIFCSTVLCKYTNMFWIFDLIISFKSNKIIMTHTHKESDLTPEKQRGGRLSQIY